MSRTNSEIPSQKSRDTEEDDDDDLPIALTRTDSAPPLSVREPNQSTKFQPYRQRSNSKDDWKYWIGTYKVCFVYFSEYSCFIIISAGNVKVPKVKIHLSSFKILLHQSQNFLKLS